MPNKLRRLTVQLQDSNFLKRLLESPHAWEEFLQQNNSILSQPSEPKFPWLTQLSLQGVDDVFFEGVRRIDHIFALGQLEELKFTFGGEFSSTLKQMTGKCLRLKVFYLWGHTSETTLSEFLVSLPPLKELALNILENGVDNPDILRLDIHSKSLTKLYLRFENNGDQSSGSCFLRLLQRGCSFPQLTEFAFSMPVEEFAALRNQDSHLPRLELLWLLQPNNHWARELFKLDSMTSMLRPLFRDDKARPKWRFFAIGQRPQNKHRLIIYEFCESLTVEEKICTGLGCVAHGKVFEHSPNLTLLNCFGIWLPWEEERNFVHVYD
ncbi:hypothetical protein AOL_s00076g436 [Orbilia oligospora ATCC 24927]|uniref:F-box domain-containing protein n=1 Tax=Arthrobotrys oligospora (strain ATCC 24927 / CBS 115.81 / DSM 1491) TaxID=756982 RepID=G1X9U7_ARTOA|nr:hypothetical protein AOL_s00076g436 [Orbilia oligospora ATCC 24927]EGX50085.1 hypothetical protein AOL_s00076g436 [Orbilia oligospora ATCC 24927]